MTFIDKIIDEGKKHGVKIAGLYERAKKAQANPDTGITIQNKGAFFVIRDCASMAVLYLPLHIYKSFHKDNLKEKFTRTQIVEFVNEEADNPLLKVIVSDINQESIDGTEDNSPLNIGEIDFSKEDDVYGDYGSHEIIEPPKKEKRPLVDIDDKKAIIEAMCEYFEAKEK